MGVQNSQDGSFVYVFSAWRVAEEVQIRCGGVTADGSDQRTGDGDSGVTRTLLGSLVQETELWESPKVSLFSVLGDRKFSEVVARGRVRRERGDEDASHLVPPSKRVVRGGERDSRVPREGGRIPTVESPQKESVGYVYCGVKDLIEGLNKKKYHDI